MNSLDVQGSGLLFEYIDGMVSPSINMRHTQ